MQHIQFSFENLNEQYKIDYVARSANGAVLYQSGGSVLLASVCAQENNKDSDFLPLSVQYIEKAYAGSKFPAGFVKREGKPSEFEILTSRVIDRTLRPLFPKSYRHITSIVVMVLSYDGKSDLQLNALNAAAAALYISDLPLDTLAENAVSGVRIGRKNGEFILNPTMEQIEQSELDLFVSGRGDELLMIEMNSIRTQSGANELPENDLLHALSLAKAYIQNATSAYMQAFKEYKKQPLSLESLQQDESWELVEALKNKYHTQIIEAIAQMSKSERNTELQNVVAQILSDESLADSAKICQERVQECVMQYKRKLVRDMILDSHIRPDGRGPKDVRPIGIETNILPYVHGSALFTRGQTQVLVSATIGGENDAQSFETLGSKASTKERFLFHYNFPGFSVGEASMIGAVGRRELGHGNLAKWALQSSVRDEDKSIRLVSEVLESNGSSSMASVCGGSLALCACGVGVESLIAGVAMGLVVRQNEYGKDQYVILTDINGLEDHDGDMDFKVAGGYRGICAMQMDIKLGGITEEILREALMQAREARIQILEIMEEARNQIVLNDEILPKTESFSIPPHKIVDIIGQGGRVIKDIIERFGVSVDLVRESGLVNVSASNKQTVQAAKEFILQIVNAGRSERVNWDGYEVGERFVGKIKKITDFGVFVELPRGGDGLVHISKITKDRDVQLGEILSDFKELECEIISQNKNKVELILVQNLSF